jgi:peptidoglycan/LPS O-acetylase OafA/YrhL
MDYQANEGEEEFQRAFSQWNTEVMLDGPEEEEDDDDDDADSNWSNAHYQDEIEELREENDCFGEDDDDDEGYQEKKPTDEEDDYDDKFTPTGGLTAATSTSSFEKKGSGKHISFLNVPTLLVSHLGPGGVSSTSLLPSPGAASAGGSAPLIKRWRKRSIALSADDKADVVATLARPKDGDDLITHEKPTSSQLVRRFGTWVHDMIFVDDSTLGKTSDGRNKVAYLGALRGFATITITIGHWSAMYMVVPNSAAKAYNPAYAVHFPRWFVFAWNVSVSVLFNGSASFRVAMFFVLPARILGLRYLSKGGLLTLAESSVRRMPRIMFPVFITALIEYFLIEVDAFAWISRLPSRSWTVWSYYQDYGNLLEFFNSYISLWFTMPPVQPAIVERYAIGIMWTVALMIQLTWSLFLCAIIARQIPNHGKRWSFYSACLFFNWYANRLDLLFILGLAVADLDCKLDYINWCKRGIRMTPRALNKRYAWTAKIRMPGQIFAWVIFFAGFGLAWSEVSGFGPSDLTTKEMAIRPDFVTGHTRGWENPGLTIEYYDLKFTCILPVLSFYLLCDLNKWFAKAFSLKLFMIIGNHSFGIYLLHGAVFWSYAPWCMIKLLIAGVPYWASQLVTIITSYMMIAVIAVIFTHTVDLWSQWLSTAFWRSVSRGYGRRPVAK